MSITIRGIRICKLRDLIPREHAAKVPTLKNKWHNKKQQIPQQPAGKIFVFARTWHQNLGNCALIPQEHAGKVSRSFRYASEVGLDGEYPKVSKNKSYFCSLKNASEVFKSFVFFWLLRLSPLWSMVSTVYCR